MKIALITTTINVPTVLLDYDIATQYFDGQVKFFISGDKKSPDSQIKRLIKKLKTSCQYYSFDQQEARWKTLSDLVGPNKIQRRNFAYIPAYHWDPDIIITIDDDNKPISIPTYFNNFADILGKPSYSNCLKSVWSNKANPFQNKPGEDAIIYKRGFSMDQRMLQNYIKQIPNPGYDVGVLQGIALGDPDIDAITRMNTPANVVKQESEQIIQKINWSYPEDWVPYNSQNTGFIKQLAPFQFVLPWVGRYDDILASYLSQAAMRQCYKQVQFGQPYAIQQRNKHNLIKDLKDQTWGMEYMDYIIDTILQPAVKNNKTLEPKDMYLHCLRLISSHIQSFDDRNVVSVEQFFKVLGV